MKTIKRYVTVLFVAVLLCGVFYHIVILCRI